MGLGGSFLIGFMIWVLKKQTVYYIVEMQLYNSFYNIKERLMRNITCYTGTSPEGKKVYMLDDTTPTTLVIREGNVYKLVRGMFGVSEVTYVRRTHDFNGFLYYLDKYMEEGSEQIVHFVGTADELLAKEKGNKYIKAAVEYLQAAE